MNRSIFQPYHLLWLLLIAVGGCISSTPSIAPNPPTPTIVPTAPVSTAAFPDVLSTQLTRSTDGAFDIAVTISSPYDTPQQYADGWRVLAQQNHPLLLGERSTQSANRVLVLWIGVNDIIPQRRASARFFSNPRLFGGYYIHDDATLEHLRQTRFYGKGARHSAIATLAIHTTHPLAPLQCSVTSAFMFAFQRLTKMPNPTTTLIR